MSAAALETAFELHRRALWALCYRMTGSGADAEDLVQDTFERAMRSPPPDIERDLMPWLSRVAINAARDHLRARRRRGYDGPFLPAPIETALDDPFWRGTEGPDARYDKLESVSFAFLLALEGLSPTQRAVLLLRDVLDRSVQETAEALGMSEANVKTSHHRARRAMEAYDRDRAPPTRAEQGRALRALHAFLVHVGTGNATALAALLRDDATMLNDGGGEFFAARKPVRGLERILRFHQKTMGALPRFRFATLNGAPAFIAERAPHGPKIPPRVVLLLDRDAAGRVRTIYWVAASQKLDPRLFVGLRPLGLRDLVTAARAIELAALPGLIRRARPRNRPKRWLRRRR